MTAVSAVWVEPTLRQWVLDIVDAIANPDRMSLPSVRGLVDPTGAPRAAIAMFKAMKARAYVLGRFYVEPEDVKQGAADVLRHRVNLSGDAHVERVTSDDVVRTILEEIPFPTSNVPKE